MVTDNNKSNEEILAASTASSISNLNNKQTDNSKNENLDFNEFNKNNNRNIYARFIDAKEFKYKNFHLTTENFYEWYSYFK